MPASLAVFTDNGFAAAQAATSFLSRNMPSMPDRVDAGGVPQCLLAQSFGADGEIYAEGDEAVSFFKVVSGVVRTCKFLSDGRRQIDAFYVESEIFGFEAGEEYGLCAEAVSDCTVIPYRRRGLENMVANDDKMAMKLFSYAMGCLERARAHALLLGRGSATQKLATFLLEMTGRKPADEVIELAMTRQDIADYLGLTVETVSRTLSQFERNGVIALSTARRIRLKNRAALRAFNS
jgi:CRP/FNR family nitrogen fixation transcriptional regulator